MTCRHCGADTPRRRDEICDACHVWRWRKGELPSEEALVRRWQKRDERRLERVSGR